MRLFSSHRSELGPHARVPTETEELLQLSRLPPEEACRSVGSSLAGLTCEEVEARLKRYGANVVTREQRPSIAKELWGRARNPLNALLVTLAVVSYSLGDVRAAAVVLVMVVLAIATSFVQEHRSNEAAARLRSMVKNTASVRRQGLSKDGEFTEVALEALVPGDVVRLSAGDMIPGDLRLLEAKDLFINQSALTGEAMPVEKFSAPNTEAGHDPFDLPNMCFMGASVVSGYATAVMVRSGSSTFFGE